MEKQEIAKFESLTQANYLLRKAQDPGARLVILNHGFNSSNTKMWERFADQIPGDWHVLAPNGPYPLPVRKDQSWQVGYSWFFFDNFKNEFFVGYDIPKEFIKNLCHHLGFTDNPKTLVGFSQGGYASPHMAESLHNVDHVIGIGCRFRIENPKWTAHLKIEAVHGEDDDTVELEGAKESFSLLPAHHQGRFQVFPGVGHRPSKDMIDTVGQWIRDPKK